MANEPFTFESGNELADFLELQIERLVENLARAETLVAIHDKMSSASVTSPGIDGNENDPTLDLLRSSVVFVHATLEDFLRSIALTLLPFADETALNNIPLAGANSSGRGEKFSLGKLAAHREKTVMGLLQESVREHLLTTTYNNTTQIASLLRELSVDTENVKSLYPSLDELIKRRHQIVHRADRTEHHRDPQERVDNISGAQVEKWIEAVKDLTAYVIDDIVSRHHGKV